MGLFDVVKAVGNFMVTKIGSEFPNEACTEKFKCRDCGLIWYLPKSVTTSAQIIIAQPGHECIKDDGKKH